MKIVVLQLESVNFRRLDVQHLPHFHSLEPFSVSKKRNATSIKKNLVFTKKNLKFLQHQSRSDVLLKERCCLLSPTPGPHDHLLDFWSGSRRDWLWGPKGSMIDDGNLDGEGIIWNLLLDCKFVDAKHSKSTKKGISIVISLLYLIPIVLIYVVPSPNHS